MIAGWAVQNEKHVRELVDLFLHDEKLVTQRIAWILSHVADKNPGLILPYFKVLIDKVQEKGVHVAVKRNVARILEFAEIPEDLHGAAMNLCFDLLVDPKETVAVRCNCMTVLANLSTKYPEIKNELRLIIEDALNGETTAGFRSRAGRTLKQIA